MLNLRSYLSFLTRYYYLERSGLKAINGIGLHEKVGMM